ncbi:hypothetical protein [uncultured Chryseobacterium sp.]|uniref:hypothetical protein n=1 Tax=uncultured Chryseobacterium sp. TaxID=259322 RepID=UPI0025D07C77|nr:hypothetical protein [uncultured Chryseobacterium sp.]
MFSAFMIAGIISAKEIALCNSHSNEQIKKDFVFKQYRITIKTLCGTTYQTIFDDQFDSIDCLYNEWEMYNNQDCGHSSYENPMT